LSNNVRMEGEDIGKYMNAMLCKHLLN